MPADDALIADQQPPIPNDRPAIADLVIADMAERKQIGIERYSVALQPFNGRDALVDAYQEAMDLCMYLRQAIAERAALTSIPALTTPTDRRSVVRWRILSPAFLRDVVAVYRSAMDRGQPPTKSVAQHFGVAHRTAGRWIAAAREAGELGAAIGTKAGEAR